MASVSTPAYPVTIVNPAARLPALPERTVALVMDEIEVWPYWPEIRRIARKEYGIAPQLFDDLLPEYQRFLGLILLGHSPVGMFSFDVDRIWHSQVLASHLWTNFCLGIHGRYINHVPQVPEGPYVGGGICTTCRSCRNCSGGGQGCEERGDDGIGRRGTAQEFAAAYLASYGSPPPAAVWDLSEAEGCAAD